MKKIPTLFERVFENGKLVRTENKITPGLEEVLERGTPTIKWDGSCCAVIDGGFYKRFDAKPGRKIPEGAIPCCDPDPITGHWPHWVKVDINDTSDKWFIEAYALSTIIKEVVSDGTYEAIGVHFNGNPYGFRATDYLVRHGKDPVDLPERTFEGIREWLETHEEEGLVFWMDGEPRAKIKRTDFGLEWPIK